jgi:hypothetical protein
MRQDDGLAGIAVLLLDSARAQGGSNKDPSVRPNKARQQSSESRKLCAHAMCQ